MYNNYEDIAELKSETGINAYISKIFGTMFLGLFLSTVAAFSVLNVPQLSSLIYGNSAVMIGLVLFELAFVFIITLGINKISYPAAFASFLLYSVVNGLTLSSIFLYYDMGSITMAFAVTAGTFGVMSVYGMVTKKDLTRFGQLALFILVGGIIATLVNFFVQSRTFDLVISLVMLVVFIGLVAYDTQKIKQYYYVSANNREMQNKLGVIGALSLYLDFVNIFLYLLRIFGRSRD